ncbi:PAS domain S-box protein [Metabacillus idriensis]|uniref:PAS domain S-box protein n=1 Tax=Metabacillus idriensis TaxID=324768 RepID=UPI002814126D|nr:PAS domain S-box protein [Metabacillus idriensis]MDR0138614.1 PAS domain S-box protein [Metabacillus idriensis]
MKNLEQAHEEKVLSQEKLDGLMEVYLNQLENSPTAFLIHENRKWTYINPSAMKLLGYTCKEDLIGKPIWNSIDPQYREMIEQRITDTKNGFTPTSMEQIWYTKRDLPINVEVTTLPNVWGDRQSTQVIIRDVTNKKKLEKEHEETIKKFRLITENMRDIVGLLDENGLFTYVSPSYKEVLGYDMSEAVGYSPFQFVHPEDREQIADQFYKMLKENRQLTVEYRYLCKDNTYIWLESHGVPVTENETLKHAIVISRNITQRKQTEEKLRKSESKYRIILEHSNDLICVVDLNGNYKYASPSYKKILGYEPESMIGQNVFNYILAEDQEKAEEIMSTLFTTKEPVTIPYHKISHSGHAVLFEGKGMAVLNQHGEPESIVFISRDITEKRKVEDYIRNYEKLTVLGELAAGVAHEIRNPLTSIKGFFKLLTEEDSGGKDKKYQNVIMDELSRIEQIVNEFMALARPQAIHLKESTNIVQLLKDTMILLNPEASLRNVDIDLQFDSDAAQIECEKNQIKQVFINVMKNAIEAMPDGGRLKIRGESKEGFYYRLTFEDNGTGIDEKRLEKLGTPFFTTKEKGIGLGLTISNKIITEHNGEFKMESELGKGTKVIIRLKK